MLRLLLVTRYYPPEVSGGARRPHGFVTALRELGVDVTICGPTGIVDEKLVGVDHPTFPVVQANAQDQIQATFRSKLMNWARRHFLLPDPEIRWAMRIVRQLKASGKSFDWVMTTSPPESLHIAGRLLKEHFSCRWVADVRDCWIERPQRLELLNSSLRRSIERILARWSLCKADILVAVSDFVMAEVATYAQPDTKCLIIQHFATPFDGIPESLPFDTVNLVHTGAISLSNPMSEFCVFLQDFEALALERPDVALWLAGNLSPHERAAIAKLKAQSQIHVLGPVSAHRARALQMGSDGLVLVSGGQSHALPGKFSEYAQTDKPIFVSAAGPWIDLIPTSVQTYPFKEAKLLQKGQTREGSSQNFNARAASEKLLSQIVHFG